MKIIIFSDSHRNLEGMRSVIAEEAPDYVFHLGDHDRDAEARHCARQELPCEPKQTCHCPWRTLLSDVGNSGETNVKCVQYYVLGRGGHSTVDVYQRGALPKEQYLS